jgi:hypothetical protein
MATKKKVENTDENIATEPRKARLARRPDFHYLYADQFRISYSDSDFKVTAVISELLGDGTELHTETAAIIMSPTTAESFARFFMESVIAWTEDMKRKELISK